MSQPGALAAASLECLSGLGSQRMSSLLLVVSADMDSSRLPWPDVSGAAV